MNKQPSFIRYRRVYEVLEADNLLRRKLSTPEIAVCRPDQSHALFPIEVTDLTEKLHEAGYDAYTLSKNDIKNFAHKVLVQNEKIDQQPMSTPTPSPADRKPLADELQERIQTLTRIIDTHKAELDDCKTALKAIRQRHEPQTPTPSPDKQRGIKAFQTMVLAMLMDPKCQQREGKASIYVQDVMKAWEAVTDEAVCYSTTHSRLYRMATRHNLIRFDGGWATLP